MKNNFLHFKNKVSRLAKLSKPTIAFGLAKIDSEILESLGRSLIYANIVVVGPKEIESKIVGDFKIVIDNNPEERISQMLSSGEVEGIVRGTLDDFKVASYYAEQVGIPSAIVNPQVILEDVKGHNYFLTSTGNRMGWTKESRLDEIVGNAIFSKDNGIDIQIAVLAGVRHDTYNKDKYISEGVIGDLNKTYEDAEWIVNELSNKGFAATNYSIDFDKAVLDGCTIIAPVNGLVGNQLFRAIMSCGGKLLICSQLGIPHLYENNSRNEKDFDFHIQWLVALINKKVL